MIGDNGTYWNTTELIIAIRVDDLQCVISEKSIGENKVFLSEYKVFGNNRLQEQMICLNMLYKEAFRSWRSIRFSLFTIRIAKRILWSVRYLNYSKHANKRKLTNPYKFHF